MTRQRSRSSTSTATRVPAESTPSGSPARSGRSRRYGSSTASSWVKRFGGGRTRFVLGIRVSSARIAASGRSIVPAPGSGSASSSRGRVLPATSPPLRSRLEALGGQGLGDYRQHDANIDRRGVFDERARLGERDQVREHVGLAGVDIYLVAEVAEARRGDPAQRVAGRGDEARHQLIAEDGLSPVAVSSPGSAGVLDRHPPAAPVGAQQAILLHGAGAR